MLNDWIGEEFQRLVRLQRAARKAIAKLPCEWKAKPYYEGGMLADPGWHGCGWEAGAEFHHPAEEEKCCDNCFAALEPRLQLTEAKKQMTKLKRMVK